jgi:hypothetical protein
MALAAILTIKATSAVLKTKEIMPCAVAVRNTPIRVFYATVETSENRGLDASVDAAPNWKRAAVLLKHLRRTYPDLQRDSP